ncbi:MAG: pirin family protein [Mariniphaga sp.]
MKKQISFSGKGSRADIGDMAIFRIIPNRYADAVGPFVFLDHIAPKIHTSPNKSGTGAHPHRGIATLTYILNGEDAHLDSAGNNTTVYSGGVQWMKAGNGIIHDESLSYDTNTENKLTHGFQFWINLPAKNKAERPEYLAIQHDEVPCKLLPEESGWIKVIAGKYENLRSTIPDYTEQFIYHIHLSGEQQYSLYINEGMEVAAFLPLHSLAVNDQEFGSGEFIEFDRKAGTVEIKNHDETAVDIIVFGGEPYTEPIVAQGPFVMNTQQEISEAYLDFYEGKYGKISYEK